MITVADLLEQVMPTGTRVVAGEIGLGREVAWATRPRPGPPAFAHLSGGELVLLSEQAISALDEALTLEAAVRQLADFGVAAIAFSGKVTARARVAADGAGVAFLHLPADADLSSIEREAAHTILERRRDVQRRGQEIGRRLMELAIAGEPVSAIVRALAELAAAPVVLEGRDGRIIAFHEVPGGRLTREKIEPYIIAKRPAILGWLRSTAAGSPADPPTMRDQLDPGIERVVAPIIGRDGLLGNISVILASGQDSSETAIVASRGSAACSIVLAREYATIVARREVELNVLDEVLDGALRNEVSLIQQAKRFGRDLNEPHIVVVARIDARHAPRRSTQPDPLGRLFDDVLSRRGSRILWRFRSPLAEILWPVPNPTETRSLPQSLFDDLSRRTDGTDEIASVGVGLVHSGLSGIQHSYLEAKQSLTMGIRLRGNGGITWFDSLGVYRLIFAADQLPELRSFHQEALGILIDYDAHHGADLVLTLRAYFQANCGPKEAASILGVHRNTILYRLERIKELTRLDLDDADTRLRLHLALCVDLALHGDQ